MEQNETGRWNVFFRRSLDGGASWTDPVLLSDATSGAEHRDADGFLDSYGEIAVTDRGQDDRCVGRRLQLERAGRRMVQHRPMRSHRQRTCSGSVASDVLMVTIHRTGDDHAC